METTLTREQEVVLKQVAHQLVLKWAESRMLIGLNQQNGLVMRDDIIKAVTGFVAAMEATHGR